ncbi:hypothetical protein [Flavobacterium rhizosphaerae]|uniref:Uncharacterized protein n=1 Tax=Flavobacterium rhizosphaerae TaxID=3163298 RepID=A0ABW8Z0U3_9FLAO
MDALDKLKNNWQKNDNYPRFSQQQIYAMLHKRSSSIVKWILIISIIEFAAWLGLNILLKDNSTNKTLRGLGLEYLIVSLSVISYGIILYFIYIFYTRYKKITATDNVKKLMSSILATRKAVRNYIYITISYNIIGAIVVLIILLQSDPVILNAYEQSQQSGDEVFFYMITIVITLLLLGLFFFAMWLIYRLIYGILLKRLIKNYEELKQMEQ